MRNLITSHRGAIHASSKEVPDLPLVSAEFDPVGDTLIVTFGPTEDFRHIEIQQISKTGTETLFATWPLDAEELSIVRSVHYFGDSNTAVVVLSTGDIFKVTADDLGGEPVVELVGTLEDAIEDASWSPDEEILAIATQKSVVFLSRALDPVAETQMLVDDLKISKHVSVGWGKAETQFQGKGAKALRDPTVPVKVDSGKINESDDGVSIKLSWRGDGEYVAINRTDKLEGLARRTIRVYSRTGELNSVSEPVDTMVDLVAWRPSGNVIASVQTKSAQDFHEGADLIFFERNGLRRYEFSLRSPGSSVKQIAWNIDSDILAVMLDDRIQLWTTKNYHWYLKQEIFSRDTPLEPQWMRWNPEKPTSLLISFGDHLEVQQFLWSTYRGSLVAPHDLGTTVVVDGKTIKLTPLKIANTPPPMAFREYEVEQTPVHVAINQGSTKFAALTRESVIISEWDPLTKPAKSPAAVSTINISNVLGFDANPKLIAFVSESVIVFTADVVSGTGLFVVDIVTHKLLATHSIEPDIYTLSNAVDTNQVVFELVNGAVYRLDEEYEVQTVSQLPQRCDSVEVWKDIAFGVTSSGKLYANNQVLASSVTSFMLTQSHVIFTTAQHYLKFSHLHENVEEFEVPADDVVNDERCRAIERGSVLVTVVPSKTALTLQAPRGNLETIHPRILVLGEIRRSIDERRYDKAFITCRTHRIDMNLLHDYAPAQFFEMVDKFVQQLAKIEYIDLFLSGLRNEDVSQTMYKQTLKENASDEAEELATQNELISKVNRICDALLAVLLKTPEKYLQSILTAYACKSPPDLEAALGYVGKDLIADPARAEFSVQHLCFLQDVELVYNTSLGIYDLDLALLVAQQSQKDPKEYLPFLQDLKESSELRRKFKIDDYLRNYSKALLHLIKIEDSFDELCEYVKHHDLYSDALRAYRYEEPKQNEILKLQAKKLLAEAHYEEAGLIYENVGLIQDALDAYNLAANWRSVFSLMHQLQLSEEKTVELRRQMAEVAEESKKYKDAAEIQMFHLKNIRKALSLLCQGYFFNDAILQASQNAESEDLIKEVVDPGLLEGFATISELISDCKGQIKSQINRLRELREKKKSDPLGFFGQPDDSEAPDNVSIAPTESSTAPSFITRYTGKTGETAKTGASRRTAKNRRREERKRARGKKGSAYEEEYLMSSIGRMVERLDQTEDNAVSLIEGLIRRGYRDHAYQIQKGFVDLRLELRNVSNEVFTQTEDDRKRFDEDGVMYLADPIPQPEIRDFPVKYSLNF